MTEMTTKPVENFQGMTSLMNTLIKIGPKISENPIMRKALMATAEKWMLNNNKNQHREGSGEPSGVIDDRTAMGLAILKTVDRALSDQKLSPATYRVASEVLGRDLFVEKKPRLDLSEHYAKIYEGYKQPAFMVISPSKACNLRCTGCYADADASLPHLEWDLVDKIVTDARNLWGLQFIVVSGGEPMAYRSQGKGILDLAEKHQDVFFMMYTNGTLITKEIAERMGQLGNVVPCMSLEGWEERTDARRGKGVYQQVMNAMDYLYDAGVLYGVSLTATRENAEEILAEDFIDYIFYKKHARIGWIFQYMPIGRSYTLDLMPTPQQRMWMWAQSWKLIREKNVFLADFWNHGTVVKGCLSAGGHNNGGYLYIEWNGNVTPCVFVPYSPVNIKDIYAKGGNITDVFEQPFFADIRKWQTANEKSNLLAPCLIRDHNQVLREFIRKHESDPIDANAASAIQDGEYAAGMDNYAAKYSELADQVWQKTYLDGKPLTSEELHSLTGEPCQLFKKEKVN